MPYKKKRQEVYDKYEGCCAYCGKHIVIKDMQIDHITPIYRDWSDLSLSIYKLERGTHEVENLNPACRVCNKWKSTFSLEQFRNEIQQQVKRLNLRSSNYRMAKMYGLIQETEIKVKFHFETIKLTN